MPFMDNITVKGTKTTYRGKETLPGVCYYMLKYIQWLDTVLADLERVGCTISSAKSQFCMPKIVIVGYLCNGNRQLLEALKVAKIILWKECKDI